jgi:hypothetical protein
VQVEVGVADTAAPTDAEEDDEPGDDAVQMWLEAPTAAESTSEPVVRTVAESDSDDDLDEVESDQDPPGARNSDLTRLSDTNIANYRQENIRYFEGKRYVRKDKLSLCWLLETWLRSQASNRLL